MPLNAFDQASRELAASMQAEGSRKIEYHRMIAGVDTFVTLINVWEGQTVFRTNSRERTFLDWSGKDFLVVASALQLAGNQITPQEGDWIVRYNEYSQTETYKLSAPTGEPLYRRSDQEGYILRIHTKKVVYAG